MTNALNQRISYSYDEDGNLTQTAPARGNEMVYEYNQRNQRSTYRAPTGTLEEYFYDVVGNLTSKRIGTQVTSYSYDMLKRLSRTTPDASFGESAISYTYKPNGQRATLADASGVTAYSYDNRNRLTSKQTPFGTLSYSYAAMSNITPTQSSNTNGLSVTYGYDVLNDAVEWRAARLQLQHGQAADTTQRQQECECAGALHAHACARV